MTHASTGRLLLASLPLLLAACGGGGGGYGDAPPTEPPAATGDVPTAALASAAAYTAFVAAQTAVTAPAPLQLGDFTAPVSDTDAPAPVQ